MYNIVSDKVNGTISISDTFIQGTYSTPTFNNIGDDYIMSFINLTGIVKLNTFIYHSTGEINSRYLSTFYRLSMDGYKWTPWMTISVKIDNFPQITASNNLFIDVKWIREGTLKTGKITLLDYNISGELERNLLTSGGSQLYPNSQITIKPPYIYKVFKITDIEILSSTTDGLNITYRYSQDYGRTISNWEPFTKENITTLRISPIRFFQIEYNIEYSGSGSLNLYDINLIGDFQNVTLDYQKTNLYGIRENCNCIKLGLINDPTSIQNQTGRTDDLLMPNAPKDGLYQLTQADKNNLYKPYQQNPAMDLLNKLSNDSINLFGHEVVYFITDPDKKGIDYTFHEYQLLNYVCDDLIKISVDQNNFPDNQIQMNQYDLSLFETFEVHITKQMFKEVFGVEKRPSKDDFLWFCELNRMYSVKHTQPFRNFNNSAVYYKIMLEKYVQKANIIGVNQTMNDRLGELTANTTINELMGLENAQDKKSVANKEQFKPLTFDLLRVNINANINYEEIENASLLVGRTNYDLSSVDYLSTAVEYRNFKNYFKISDNIGFTSWFNINNYTLNDIYNFINYYDVNNSLGLKINLCADNIMVTMNSDSYTFSFGTGTMSSDALLESTWYCYVSNIDQRNGKLTQYIYKRNSDLESDAKYLSSSVLQLVYSNTQSINPVEFELDTDIKATILGSDMKITNIRMFLDVIPPEQHNKILNQYMLRGDSKYLIFADNANKTLILPNESYNQNDPNKIRKGTDNSF